MATEDCPEFYGAGSKNELQTSTLRPRADPIYSGSRSTSNLSSGVTVASSAAHETPSPTQPGRKKNKRSSQKEDSPIEDSQRSSPLSSIVKVEFEFPETPHLRPRTRSQSQQSPTKSIALKTKMGPMKENCEFLPCLPPIPADILW